MEWAAGHTVGPYELVARIGAGGMGEVWKAHDPRLDRSVAIKRLSPEHAQRFAHEARAIAALNHPNICQIHDLGPDYLVLEYIEGTPLMCPYKIAEAVRLADQIVSALEASRAKGIVHRDLKPGNILVTATGTVKLLDFGLATVAVNVEGDLTRAATNTVSGTASYMSPEQAQGKRLDPRSDRSGLPRHRADVLNPAIPRDSTKRRRPIGGSWSIEATKGCSRRPSCSVCFPAKGPRPPM